MLILTEVAVHAGFVVGGWLAAVDSALTVWHWERAWCMQAGHWEDGPRTRLQCAEGTHNALLQTSITFNCAMVKVILTIKFLVK